MRRHLLPAVAAGLVLVACGGSSGGIGIEAASRLQPWVDKVRSEAAGGNVRKARDALAGLRTDVANLQRDGVLDPEDASRVLAAADRVEDELAVATTTTSTPSTTARSPRSTSATTTSTSTSSTSTTSTTTKPPETKPEEKKKDEGGVPGVGGGGGGGVGEGDG